MPLRASSRLMPRFLLAACGMLAANNKMLLAWLMNNYRSIQQDNAIAVSIAAMLGIRLLRRCAPLEIDSHG